MWQVARAAVGAHATVDAPWPGDGPTVWRLITLPVDADGAFPEIASAVLMDRSLRRMLRPDSVISRMSLDETERHAALMRDLSSASRSFGVVGGVHHEEASAGEEADPSPEAFALPGLPGRIVVSTGMLATLDPDERRVLPAHERAHLRCHHYLFIAAVQLAATANPLLRPAATAVTYTVERWADEDAAATCGDRRLVATAIGKAALAARHTSAGPATALARWSVLGIRGAWPRRRSSSLPAGGSLKSAGPLPRRVAALLAAPITTRPLPVYLTVVLLVATGLCCLESANDLYALLKLAHHSR